MTTYADKNVTSLKALKLAVKAGERIGIFSAGLGVTPIDGTAYLSGPHYPAPHKWYAEVVIKGGVIVKVK